MHALKFIDLRWNRLDHMDGPLNLPVKFEHLYLAGRSFETIFIHLNETEISFTMFLIVYRKSMELFTKSEMVTKLFKSKTSY